MVADPHESAQPWVIFIPPVRKQGFTKMQLTVLNLWSFIFFFAYIFHADMKAFFCYVKVVLLLVRAVRHVQARLQVHDQVFGVSLSMHAIPPPAFIIDIKQCWRVCTVWYLTLDASSPELNSPGWFCRTSILSGLPPLSHWCRSVMLTADFTIYGHLLLPAWQPSKTISSLHHHWLLPAVSLHMWIQG